ncbi:MAG: C-type lysozyme/alpha-lactalbumin family [Acidimicrobiales bacterium]|nr:C-type lysozyme/alpha-lactalbumin family [Acidimicrobiales bacterium]
MLAPIPAIVRRTGLLAGVAVLVALSLAGCTPEQNRQIGLDAFRKVKASARDLTTVDCIMYRESRYQSDALHYNSNGTVDRGLFQINSVHAADWRTVTGQDYLQTWHNPAINARYAADLYRRYGLGPWGGSCSR